MDQSTAEKAEYGNWVSTKLVVVPGVIGLFFVALAFLLPGLILVALVFFLCALYFAYARYQFSPQGRDIQTRIRNLVIDHTKGWDGTGRILDIGCGNGPLSIDLAKAYPQAQVLGVDYWGGTWEYSKAVCERNAELEGVADRVSFERASALALPYDDGAFDLVVSNLVFHEVHDARDKKLLLKEALRVVRPGGWFVFQDLFLWKQVYGPIEDLVASIGSWGIKTVNFVDTSISDFIPRLLKLPFMVGTLGIFYGRK